jgi:hypothetical protein
LGGRHLSRWWIDADDGRWYELFLRVQFHQSRRPTYHPPVTYLEGVNGGNAVKALTGLEAKQFVAFLSCDSPRFVALSQVIAAEGDAAR